MKLPTSSACCVVFLAVTDTAMLNCPHPSPAVWSFWQLPTLRCESAHIHHLLCGLFGSYRHCDVKVPTSITCCVDFLALTDTAMLSCPHPSPAVWSFWQLLTLRCESAHILCLLCGLFGTHRHCDIKLPTSSACCVDFLALTDTAM